MRETLQTLPRLRRPAAVNAAEYWLAPERFARRCRRSEIASGCRCPGPGRGCA